MFKTKRIYLLNQRNLTRHPCKSLKKKREYDFFSKTFFLRNKKHYLCDLKNDHYTILTK